MMTAANDVHPAAGPTQVIRRTPKYTGPERRKKKRRRPQPLRVLVSLLVIIAAAYIAAALWLMGRESQVILEAGRTLGPGRPPIPYEQIDIPRTDGTRQFAWLMPRRDAPRAPWTVFLHGNASTIASNVNIAHYRELQSAGLNVLAPEYRGFGGLEGTASEASLDADARAAYDYLRVTRKIAPARIVLYGWSLGSGVAIDLASTVDHAALVLEAAPSSQASLSRRRYPLFPIGLLMRNRFDSIGKIDRVRSPILFLHSPDDEVIPIEEGRRLYEAARGDKAFVEVRGGHVNAPEVDADRFSDAIRTFLKQRGILSPALTP
jgi:fermentation-respiration switch protein FrsA (DUF1100 family)